MKMSTRYKFSPEEIAEIQEARRKNTDKRVDRRLKAIEMRALGQSLEEVGHTCEYHPSYITTLVAKYRDGGLAALVDNHYHGKASFVHKRKSRAPLSPTKN